MGHDQQLIEKIDVLFAAEGCDKHFSQEIGLKTTVSAFALLAAKAAQLDGDLEVSLEDADAPLKGHDVLAEQLPDRFAPIHVSRPGRIRTVVHYNGKKVAEDFRSNVTIARVTAWAIGPDGFRLEGGPSDYQIKHDGHVVSPDDHLGQVARDHKKVELELVWKLKPQGEG